MSSRKKNSRAATSKKRGKRNVDCLEEPLEILTAMDNDREKETVPHANNSVRVQVNACSRNAKHSPVAHQQETADCEIGIGIQQSAAVRHTLTDNIGIQQTSVVANMDDHRTTQSETNAANQCNRTINIPKNTDIGAIASFVSMSDRTIDTSSLSEEPRSDVAEHIQELFQKKKFITTQEELAFGGGIATFFLKRINMPDSVKENWWAGTLHTVRKAIDSKRSTVSIAMKTEFMSKYNFTFTIIEHIRSNSTTLHHIQTTGLVLGNALPELQEIMKLRQQGYKVIMTTFYNHFLSCVMGKCKWKKHVILKEVPLFATVTDEAFALLVLENNWGVWLVEDPKEYFIKNKKEQDKKQKQNNGLYTGHAKGATRFGGWSLEGVQRFNDLCDFVRNDRIVNETFDTEYYETMSKQKVNNGKKIKRMIVAYDELDNDNFARV